MAQAPRRSASRNSSGADDVEPPLLFGERRIGIGWIGIAIAGAAFLVIGAAQVAAGDPMVMLAIGPVLAVFALACATTRQVRIDPARREVRVTRRLLGLEATRRLPLSRFRSVVVRMDVVRPRLNRSPLTPEGDQQHAHYTVALRGRGRLRLATIHGEHPPPRRREAAEGLARALAVRAGLGAERDGYTTLEGPDGTQLSVRRRRPRFEPIPARGVSSPSPR